MPDVDNRVVLWRNAIQLFHEYNRPKFVGPFKELNFSYVVERTLLTKTGEDKKPDITASGDTGWMALELTLLDSSKKEKLASYGEIDPSYIHNYGLQTHTCRPDVISARLSFVDDGPHCQLILKDKIQAIKTEFIQNKELATALVKSNNQNIECLPEIPVSILPEMKAKEIRKGLVDIVMRIFDPRCEGITPADMVKAGLERLWDLVGHDSHRSLIDKVKNEMDILMKEHLSYYLIFDGEKYTYSSNYKPHANSRGKIAEKLAVWSGSTQKTVDDYLIDAHPPAEVE